MWLAFWLTALKTQFTTCISLQQLSIPHPPCHCTWSINRDEEVCIMYVFPRQSYNKNQRQHHDECRLQSRPMWCLGSSRCPHTVLYSHGLALSIVLRLMSQHTPNVSDSWVRWLYNSVSIVHMLKHTRCTNRIRGTARIKHAYRMHTCIELVSQLRIKHTQLSQASGCFSCNKDWIRIYIFSLQQNVVVANMLHWIGNICMISTLAASRSRWMWKLTVSHSYVNINVTWFERGTWQINVLPKGSPLQLDWNITGAACKNVTTTYAMSLRLLTIALW